MIGLSYTDLLDRDIRFFNNCMDGYIQRREVKLNDEQMLGQRIACKIAQYVWGNKKATNPLERIRLTEETSEEKIMRTLKAKGLA